MCIEILIRQDHQIKLNQAVGSEILALYCWRCYWPLLGQLQNKVM